MNLIKYRAGFLIHEFQKPARLSFPTHLIPISIVPVGLSAAFGAAWGPLGTVNRPGKMSGAVYARLGCAYARREFWRQKHKNVLSTSFAKFRVFSGVPVVREGFFRVARAGKGRLGPSRAARARILTNFLI